MDLTSTLQKKQKNYNKKYLIVILISLIALFLIWAGVSFDNNQSVDQSDVRIAQVKQGTFKVNVSGYGRLKAKYQRLLTSQSQAIVESILLYPGAKVNKDTVIMTLSDPQLEQAVINAKLELARQNAEFNQQVIAHKSEVLEREAQIALLNSELENAQLKAQAEEKLIDKGIVSLLDFKRSQLNVRQLEQRVTIEKTRQDHLKAMQVERMKISQDLITQYQHNFNMIKTRFDRLHVTAGIDGILQTLPVEIGQSVMPGTQLAMVGSDQKLKAQLLVQQNQADQIVIGMSASVMTSGKNITAKVSRIDPVITDGRVMVELDLTGPLPANARPELTVEGKVHVKEINNALYVEQPNNVYNFKEKDIYRMSSDAQSAQLTTIKFGTLSGNQIEVISGAVLGDKLIVSDMSQYSATQKNLVITL
jgi:multidrug efflux pump subunit AcrA (membrane-fusion protein)